MYDGMDTDNRRKFRELYCARYIEVFAYLVAETKLKKSVPDEDTVDELAEMYITGLLSEPNETTHYTYDTEVYRKRDRAVEAINSVNGKVLKQIEMDKYLRQWSAMTGWYLDFTSQGAEVQAFKDVGIKRVQRHEILDNKTCKTCADADGEIYDIDKVPPLPHLRCRRWFTAAR